MRSLQVWKTGALLLLLLFAQRCSALDWKAFEDPKTVVIADTFAKSIDALPAPEKMMAIRRLHEALQAQPVEIRRRAALTLGKLGDKSGVPTMIADLPKTTGSDHNNVVVALRILKDQRAISALRAALKDRSPYVRGIALAALGELKATQAYGDIAALTRDKEPGGGCMLSFPAQSACYALECLGDQRAVPVLIGLLDDKDLQAAAVHALEVLTKQKFGVRPEKWRDWWQRH